MAEEIILSIQWTERAKSTFNNIISYLETEWTEKEVSKFINRTQKVLETLKRYPEMCRPSQKRKDVRIAILNKHTQMVYHFKPRKKQLEILLFWNPKLNPAKFKY
jgi:plasmid stabilization system protein ParE